MGDFWTLPQRPLRAQSPSETSQASTMLLEMERRAEGLSMTVFPREGKSQEGKE
jgi:hypothetical protein